jgi:hypothetical protein
VGREGLVRTRGAGGRRGGLGGGGVCRACGFGERGGLGRWLRGVVEYYLIASHHQADLTLRHSLVFAFLFQPLLGFRR